MTRPAGKRRSRRIRGGALFVISVLMIGSAALRIGLQAGPAIAREASHIETASDSETDPDKSAQAAPQSEELQVLIVALNDREQALKKREIQLEDRLKAMEIADEAIKQKLEELQSAERQLSATLALAEVASEDDLTTLTSVYEKMKPKQSAALFEEMDPEFAAGFLARMRPETAANVMAGLSPMTAYSISVVLAGRNASAPKQ